MLGVDESNFGAIAGITAFTAVVGVAAVWLVKTVGTWFRGAIVQSVTDGIHDITAPDLEALASRVTTSIDELSASISKAIEELALANNKQHELADVRLTSVETRLTDVETRLSTIELRLGIPLRSPESRTRETDVDKKG